MSAVEVYAHEVRQVRATATVQAEAVEVARLATEKAAAAEAAARAALEASASALNMLGLALNEEIAAATPGTLAEAVFRIRVIKRETGAL